MMKKIWAMRKDGSAVSPVIATILMVAITVVLAAVLYVMVLGLGTTGTITPTIGTNKGSTSTAVTWTVSAISGGSNILKTDVYVQVKYASNGTFAITTTLLSTASTTHGFLYSSASGTGLYISVGDTFSLSKTAGFTQGDTLTLVQTSAATGQYCVLTY
jgi:flagellin-like protein